MNTLVKRLMGLAVLLLLPSSVSAQATLTGTVRDDSGGILPGVTVEAASPVLIEKLKTATTDASGQYRIVDLRSGIYTLKFTLPGFSTVERTDINLAGSQIVTLSVDLKIGGLQETITVTGDTPVVDVQSVRREVVLDQEVIQTIPSTRAVGGLLNVTPGLTVGDTGFALSPTMTFFSANGGDNNEGRMAVNGMTVGAARSGGVSSYVYDAVGVEEVAVRVGGGLGETDTGGPIMNIVPRSGGNTFRGTGFLSLAGDWSKGNNIERRLRAHRHQGDPRHHPGARHQHLLWRPDSSRPPLVLWPVSQPRYADGRRRHHREFQRGRAASWDWMSSAVNSRLVQDRQMAITRLAGQAGKSRIQANYEYQKRCEGTNLNVGGTAAISVATTGSVSARQRSRRNRRALRVPATSNGRSTCRRASGRCR